MRQLDGPRLAAASGRTRQLVVLLHGYGSNGDDLIQLGQQWRRLLPDAAFVAPHAPESVPMAYGGYQWFHLTLRDPAEYWRGVTQAQPVLDAFLDAELARHRLDERGLALVGFSQGTMMALHAGLLRPRAPAAIVGYSGRLAGVERYPGIVRVRPPVLLVHGDQDDVIPVDALNEAREALAAAGVPVQWHVSYGVGHGIDAGGLRHAGRFIADAFAATTDH